MKDLSKLKTDIDNNKIKNSFYNDQSLSDYSPKENVINYSQMNFHNSSKDTENVIKTKVVSNIMSFNQKTEFATVLELYKRIFAENDEIYMFDHEFDPTFYQEIIDTCFPLARDKNINVICGPDIAVEDDFFKKYYHVHLDFLGYWWASELNKESEWWKIHPLFEIAYNNPNINIFISKHRYYKNGQITKYFTLGNTTKDVIMNEGYEEIKDTYLNLYSRDTKLTQILLKDWNNMKEAFCYKWEEDQAEEIFKPLIAFRREEKIGLGLERDISKHGTKLYD